MRTKQEARADLKQMAEYITAFRRRATRTEDSPLWPMSAAETQTLKEFELRFTWMSKRIKLGDYREECETDGEMAKMALAI